MIAEGLAINGAKVHQLNSTELGSDMFMPTRLQVYISSRKAAACESTAAELNALVQARSAIEGWTGGMGGQVIALPADLSTFEVQ
jgi:hypothetical protein